ncbi:MAG: hypothetical protein PHN60_04190 [Candidatus Gracilibacteria bacterium]|nr:hypothetical protein [Candidatus Gracilibacteria bacterium]
MLKALDIETSHDKEKVRFVLRQIKTFINPNDCGCMDFSLTDEVYDEILSTSNDGKGISLQDNKALQDELTEISLGVITDFQRILNGITQGTIEFENVTKKVF